MVLYYHLFTSLAENLFAQWHLTRNFFNGFRKLFMAWEPHHLVVFAYLIINIHLVLLFQVL